MNADWQTLTAAGAVMVTAAMFVFRMTRPKRKSGGCGKGCGCGKRE